MMDMTPSRQSAMLEYATWLLSDYAKIVSDDESKRLYTVKLCLIDNEDSCNL